MLHYQYCYIDCYDDQTLTITIAATTAICHVPCPLSSQHFGLRTAVLIPTCPSKEENSQGASLHTVHSSTSTHVAHTSLSLHPLIVIEVVLL